MLDESTKAKLQQTLKDIRRNLDNTRDLVEELEDKKLLDGLFSDASQYMPFYREYTVKLIQKYVLDIDKQEIMLAAYGLLDEHQRLRRVNSRRIRYFERAVGVNQLIDPTWANPDESLPNIEDDVIEQLADRLIQEATDNPEKKGWLNFANTVANDLLERFPNGFPAELPLPVPRYRLSAVKPSLGASQESAPPPSQSSNPEPGVNSNDKSQFTKLLMGVGVLVIVILLVIGAIISTVVYITAANRGQVEILASSYNIRLDFRADSYDRPPTPTDGILWGEEIPSSQD